MSRLAIHLIKWNTQPLDDLRKAYKRLALWWEHFFASRTFIYNELQRIYVTIMSVHMYSPKIYRFICVYLASLPVGLELHTLRKSNSFNNKWTHRSKDCCCFNLPVLYNKQYGVVFGCFLCLPVDWSTIDGSFFKFISLLLCFVFFHIFSYEEANFQRQSEICM